MKFNVEVKHTSGLVKVGVFHGKDWSEVEHSLRSNHKHLTILGYTPMEDPINEVYTKKCSRLKKRSHYKARITQVRNNLRSMCESEESLLTEEELLQLSRIGCKIDRVLALFHSRTLDMKLEGKL